MAEIYGIMEVADAEGKPTGKFHFVSYSDEVPLSRRVYHRITDKDYGSREEAEACPDAKAAIARAFGSTEEPDTAEIHPDAMEELRQCAVMIRTWMPASFPENEQGQKHFVRVVMESVADVIDRVAPPAA
jgi:hypothetical protein